MDLIIKFPLRNITSLTLCPILTLQNSGAVPFHTAEPRRPEDNLDDLLIGADDSFDLLEYADAELDDATLNEDHDKNMFDEHLGGAPSTAPSSAPSSEANTPTTNTSTTNPSNEKTKGSSLSIVRIITFIIGSLLYLRTHSIFSDAVVKLNEIAQLDGCYDDDSEEIDTDYSYVCKAYILQLDGNDDGTSIIF